MIVALVLWVWRSWTNPRGLVDLHVLKDRNLRTGCVLVAMLGMCIYITIAILPLYYQEIMGYTAFAAGLVVGPRGIGSFIGSFFIGFLGSRMDNRKLMTAGFLGFAACSFIFGNGESVVRALHAADSDHAYRVCAQLCVCSDVHIDDVDDHQQKHGRGYGLC